MSNQNQAPQTTKLLSLKEASKIVGLSDWTLRRWALQGRIASVCLGRRRLIPASVIDELIRSNWHEANGPEDLRLT